MVYIDEVLMDYQIPNVSCVRNVTGRSSFAELITANEDILFFFDEVEIPLVSRHLQIAEHSVAHQ